MIRSRNLLFVLALGIAGSACAVRGTATMSGSSGGGVVYQEPPAPQADVPGSARPGFIWIRGRWDWRGGQWTWVGGHWERERAGYSYNEGRWERRGNGWYWVEGTWVTGGAVVDTSNAPGGTTVTSGAGHDHHPGHHGGGGGVVDTSNSPGGTTVTSGAGGQYPTAAPPPPRSESYGSKSGFVWVTGRWDWRGGQWAWVDGHWERERANQVWIAGRWELQGNYYVWIEGRWGTRGQQQSGPQVRDHR
jgi:WXXGXW repeat (2 copies)